MVIQKISIKKTSIYMLLGPQEQTNPNQGYRVAKEGGQGRLV